MAIFIKPVNKTLLVEREPVSEKKNEFGIIIPETKQKVENNCLVKLIACEEKSIYEKYEGQNLLVRAAMLEDVEIKGTRGTFLSESGVIAVVAESGML